MGHISDAPSGQGLPLRTSIGTYSWASGRLLLTFALVILLGRLAVQSHVTLVAELLGRLIIQRAVRTYRVVLPPKPAPFFPGVPVVLELLALQELVSETAVKRLADSVLPRTSRRHRDRLGPLLG